MKVTLKDLRGKEIESLELPSVFNTPYRPEIIKKVYVNVLSNKFQPQGRYPAAGEMVSAESRNTGLGIARIARAERRRISTCWSGRGCCKRQSWKVSSSPSFMEEKSQKNKQEGKAARFLFCSCSNV